MISRLSIFNAYDYYHVTAAQRDLSSTETRFYRFCMEHHESICCEDTFNNDPIIVEASKLFENIS